MQSVKKNLLKIRERTTNALPKTRNERNVEIENGEKIVGPTMIDIHRGRDPVLIDRRIEEDENGTGHGRRKDRHPEKQTTGITIGNVESLGGGLEARPSARLDLVLAIIDTTTVAVVAAA